MINLQLKAGIIGFFLFTLIGCAPQKAPEAQRPNFVIILADDQGWGDLSMNGNPVVSTPNLDKMGREGLIFDRFYVHAVCSPTRAALLTGRYAVRGGVYSTSAGGERLDLDEHTFAEAFQEAGYATGAFGKWHNGMQAPYHPNARGFDEFYGYCSGHWGSYFDAMLEHNGEMVQSKGYLTDVLTKKAMDFIGDHQDDPFLVYLPLNTPHSPMQVSDKWFAKFKDMPLPEHRYSQKEKPDHTRAAYAMTENIDWNVGRVNHLLDSLGLAENTIVIYFSDNGPNGWRWNGGMEGTKGSVNEGGVRSPMIMYGPGQFPAGRTVDQISSVMDLYPTLVDWAGLTPTASPELDGLSLTSLIQGESANMDDRVIVNHWRGRTSVRTQQYRLDEDGQVFDMQADPGQTKDLRQELPGVFSRLDSIASAWEETVQVELPEEDPRPFVVAAPGFPHTQLPARDAIAHGDIKRSNRWPNCSFYTNWTNEADSITWDVEVLEAGTYNLELYYTLAEGSEGTVVDISMGETIVSATIDKAFDPPLRGMEWDKFDRGESYVKDWATITLEGMRLEKGSGRLVLKSPTIQGAQGIDFRLLMLHRQENPA